MIVLCLHLKQPHYISGNLRLVSTVETQRINHALFRILFIYPLASSIPYSLFVCTFQVFILTHAMLLSPKVLPISPDLI